MAINSITFKGVSSNTIQGLLIQSLPPITVPQMRTTETYVDGRDGSIIEELGYSAYDKTIVIGLYGNYDIDAVISFFSGEGNLIMSNEPNKVYKAKITAQIDFNRLVRYRTASVVFRVQPFKYKLNESSVSLVSSGSVSNVGNIKSRPKITITGSGTIEFKIAGTTIFSYTYPTGESTVIIDSAEEDAHISDGTLRNRYMTGEFPVLSVGANAITTTGTVTQIVIEPNSRWL